MRTISCSIKEQRSMEADCPSAWTSADLCIGEFMLTVRQGLPI